MLVTTENLSIGYRNYIVQSNLNLVVENGDLICMLGTNGCGKSTLLRTLAGLQPSLAGKVLLQGQSLDDLSSQQKAKLFALVLTDPVEAKNMTVYDVIALGRYPYSSWLGNLSEEDKHFIQRALLQVKLQHKTFSRISELSDGERQRVMIARALAQDTPLILLDEPTAHLDLPNRVDTMLLLRRLAHETGKAVVLSTHELDLALQTADKLWLMSPQKGMYCGLPEDLVLSGAFQEVFASQSFFFNPAAAFFTSSKATDSIVFSASSSSVIPRSISFILLLTAPLLLSSPAFTSLKTALFAASKSFSSIQQLFIPLSISCTVFSSLPAATPESMT